MEQRLMAPPPAALKHLSGTDAAHDPNLVPQYQHSIEACLQCFDTCEQMISHCNADSQKVDPSLIRLLNDAVEISQVAATFMLRGSNFHIRTCAVCAEVCRVAAEACEKTAHQLNDELLNNCASVLRECAESCYQMAHHH